MGRRGIRWLVAELFFVFFVRALKAVFVPYRIFFEGLGFSVLGCLATGLFPLSVDSTRRRQKNE
jgi:hypothetical protein